MLELMAPFRAWALAGELQAQSDYRFMALLAVLTFAPLLIMGVAGLIWLGTKD